MALTYTHLYPVRVYLLLAEAKLSVLQQLVRSGIRPTRANRQPEVGLHTSIFYMYAMKVCMIEKS